MDIMHIIIGWERIYLSMLRIRHSPQPVSYTHLDVYKRQVYTLSDNTRKLLQKHYTKQPQEIEVTEINIDTLQMKEISYGRDGEVVRLQKGKDYAVEKNEPEQGWKTYTYKIGRHNFQKEGNYTVTLSSKDRAENRGNNKIKGEEINFVVDQTAPTVVVTGIENYGKYKESSKKMMKMCIRDSSLPCNE